MKCRNCSSELRLNQEKTLYICPTCGKKYRAPGQDGARKQVPRPPQQPAPKTVQAASEPRIKQPAPAPEPRRTRSEPQAPAYNEYEEDYGYGYDDGGYSGDEYDGGYDSSFNGTPAEPDQEPPRKQKDIRAPKPAAESRPLKAETEGGMKIPVFMLVAMIISVLGIISGCVFLVIGVQMMKKSQSEPPQYEQYVEDFTEEYQDAMNQAYPEGGITQPYEEQVQSVQDPYNSQPYDTEVVDGTYIQDDYTENQTDFIPAGGEPSSETADTGDLVEAAPEETSEADPTTTGEQQVGAQTVQ